MVNNNHNLPPVEEIRYLDTEIPTFAEFMKTYQADDNLNYADLSGGDISEAKGYGPCISSSCDNYNTFKLKIHLKNCVAGEKRMTVYNTKDARDEANAIIAEKGNGEDGFGYGCFSQEDRQKLANRIKEKIDGHEEGHDVDTEVCNKDESSSWGTGYTSYEQVEIMNFYTKP